MPGIILLDEEQQQELYRTQQRSNWSDSSEQRRPAYLTNHGLQRAPYFPVDHLPRTDFTSQRNVDRTDFTVITRRTNSEPRTDFRSSGEDTAPASSTDIPDFSATMDSMAHMVLEEYRQDSYPILRRRRTNESSVASPSNNHDAGQYAGTSSGLKISVTWIFVGLVVGLTLGIVLSETSTARTTARWISLPGDLFLRALKCLVIPYVFCSVAVAIGDIVFVGKVSIIGVQTIKIYGIFSLSTVTMGVCVALLCRPLFRVLEHQDTSAATAIVGFTCANGDLMSLMANGSVVCSTSATSLTNSTTFKVTDLSDTLSTSVQDFVTFTLSDQAMGMILQVVSSNIIASLANMELLSIITFSMVLGAIAGRSYFTKTRRVNYLYLTLLQLRNTFFLLMEWTIWLSPVAVVSIVAGTFASNPKFLSVFGHVYPYILAMLLAALIQVLLVYPFWIFVLTRTNPYSHMKNMIRAYMFAFACASSLGTMPVTLSCVKAARMCSQSLANFVVSIGVPASTSGVGYYLPIALVFLAESSGNGSLITPLRIVGIFVLSLLMCAGTPPIPSAGLVVITTTYTTLFGEVPTTAFGYIAAMDFFVDRVVTTCNVNDDVMALKIISETTDETVAQDHLGERF